MNKMYQWILSFLLVLPLMLVTAWAAESGTCGDNVTWTLGDSGDLTISGTGDMYDYNYYSQLPPWGKNIQTVLVEDGVTSIGEYAFYDCIDLSEAIVPNSITSMGSYAFSGCDGLTSITIPDSVISMEGGVFYSCKQLTDIYYSGTSTQWENISIGSISNDWLKSTTIHYFSGEIGGKCGDNLTWILKNNGELIISGTGKMIEYGYETNRKFAPWREKGVQAVFIENGATSIGGGAFSDCSGLTSVTISNSLTGIGDYAFADCSSLTDIVVPENVESIGKRAFWKCKNLANATLSKNMTSIGSAVFYYCTGLTSLVIPNGVTNIEDSAFYGCSSLTSLTISEDITNIGRYASYGCTQLTDVYYSGTRAQWNDIAIDETGNDPLKSATIHCSDDPLEFSGTCGLDGDNLHWILTSDGLLTISGTGYMENYYNGMTPPWRSNEILSSGLDIKRVVIEDGTMSIGTGAFDTCTQLNEVTIPGSVTSIGDWAFNLCGGLKSITIPEGVTSIGVHTFYGCGSLTDITIPNGVTSIGNEAFYNCTGLSEVTISDSVTNIGSSAFYGCSQLTDVYYSGTKAQWGSVSINETGNDPLKSAIIHCSDGDIKPETPVDPTPPEPDDPMPSEPDDPAPPNDAVLDINRSLTVPARKRLNILSGVPLKVLDGAALRIDGTLSVSDAWTNEGTVEITGTVTTEKGIHLSGGIVEMGGGSITSGDAGGTIRGDGEIQLGRGTITNTGSGPAVHLSAVSAEVSWDRMTVRSRTEHPILLNGEPYVPDGYRVVRQSDGYYTLVRA